MINGQQSSISDSNLDIVQRPRKSEHSKPTVRNHSKNRPNIHNCPYNNCERVYKSSIAMNLHIKMNHNGGTKKQR